MDAVALSRSNFLRQKLSPIKSSLVIAAFGSSAVA
jgi:hypothetical protein